MLRGWIIGLKKLSLGKNTAILVISLVHHNSIPPTISLCISVIVPTLLLCITVILIQEDRYIRLSSLEKGVHVIKSGIVSYISGTLHVRFQRSLSSL